MKASDARRSDLVHERLRRVVERFDEHVQVLADACAAAERDASARRSAAESEHAARVAEYDRLGDEIAALADAVLSHPMVRELGQIDVAPAPTLHEDESIEALRRLYVRRRERAFAALPGLHVPDVTRRDPSVAVDPAPDGGDVDEDEATFHVSEPSPSAVTASVEAESPAPATATADRALPASTRDDDVGTERMPVDANVSRCSACGASIPPGAEGCPSCSPRGGTVLAVADSVRDVPPEFEARPRRAWMGLLVAFFVVALMGLVGVPNVWPGVVARVPVLCSVPGLGRVIPCPRVLTTSDAVLAALQRTAQAGGGIVTLAEGTFSLPAPPPQLSGNVTIRGAGHDVSVLRIEGSGGGLRFTGGGTLQIVDVGVLLMGGGGGDVVTMTGGTVRLERIAVAGGTPGTNVTGGGLVFGGSVSGVVRDCIVQANEFGVWVAGTATPSITGCTIAANRARGVSYHGDSRGELVANTIERNGYGLTGTNYWQGVALQDRAAPVIRNNMIRDNAGIGVQYRDSSGGRFSGNRVSGNGWSIQLHAEPTASVGGLAVGVRGSDHRPSPTIASDNTFSNNYGGDFNHYR